MSVRRAACAVAGGALLATAAPAQVVEKLDTLAARVDSMLPHRDTLPKRVVRGLELAPGAIRCSGQRITRIEYEPRPPGFSGKGTLTKVAMWPVRTFHMTTRARVLRAYLLLKEGAPCREVARQESERVIRSLWFVQDVQVAAFPDGDGVRIEVRSIDELSIVANPQMNGVAVVGGRWGWNNVAGLGALVEVGSRDNGLLREGYSLRLRLAQTLGRPVQAGFEIERRGLGETWTADLRYPFLTDLQRYAFRAVLGSDDDYVEYRRADAPIPFQAATRGFAAIGGVRRFGSFGRTMLLGASLTHDDEDVGLPVFVDSVTGAVRPFAGLVPTPAPPRSVTRLNALVGARALRFRAVEGFDALTGTQDIRLGVQASAQLGRSLSRSTELGDAFFLGAEVYAGWGSDRWYGATEWFWSGRHDGEGWDGRVVSGRTALMAKPWPRALSSVDVQYVGAGRMRVPFAVPIGGGATGLAGFARAREVGESRLRLRVEQRQFLGRPFGLLDFGTALFAETGQLWAGETPFGIDTGWRQAVGIALLGAVPPRSRSMLRLDVVWPLQRDAFVRGVQLRAVSGNLTRFFWRDPGEARRGRERSLFSDLFSL